MIDKVMDTQTAAFYGIGIAASAVIGIGMIYVIATRGTGFLTPIIPPMFGLMFAVASFLPFGLLMFGFISDIINGDGFHNSYPGCVALASVIASFILGKVGANALKLNISPVNTTSSLAQGGWCTIPGLEALESPFMPMSMLISSIIITYYSIFLGTSNITLGSQATAIASLVGIYAIEIIAFYASACIPSYVPLFGNFSYNLILTTIIGAGIGAAAYAFVVHVSPSLSPFQQYANLTQGVQENFTPKAGFSFVGPHAPTAATQKPTARSEPTTCAVASNEVGDENTYVAEIYKNGQLVTEKIA